ncbi:MAG: nascent polypeptide-associated complex protein [Candidatus Thermoplasmatota archaeon]
MFPGIGRGSEKQMRAAMRRMGITQEEIADVEEVIIRTRDREIMVKGAQVTEMTVQGQRLFQVMGEVQVRERGAVPEPLEPTVPEEDVRLVAAQAGVGMEEARQALVECGGEPAEAIVLLMGRKR